MQLTIRPQDAAAWAKATTKPLPREHSEASITEPLPHVVVTYDRQFDDLSVVNLEGSLERMDTDEVPWAVGRRVVSILKDRGLVDEELSIDDAAVSFVRSGVKGPGGVHDQWVDEVLFEVNTRIAGIVLLDAGLRIGVAPSGVVSSLRLTSVDVEQLDTAPTRATGDYIRATFSAHLGHSAANLDAVTVLARRPAYLLEPGAASAIVEPGYFVLYSTTTRMGNTPVASRASMALIDIGSPDPKVTLVLPERAESPHESKAPQ